MSRNPPIRRVLCTSALGFMLAGCQLESATESTAATTAAPAPPQLTGESVPKASPAQSQAPDPDVLQGVPNKIAPPAAGADTPRLPDVANISYVCENGMAMQVTYEYPVARVVWTDGATLTLSLTAAPGPNGERYEGEGYVLKRIANVIELAQPNGANAWRCSEGASTA